MSFLFFIFFLNFFVGQRDPNQRGALSAADQWAVKPSASANAAAAQDQWPAEGDWNHPTDQSILLILPQHVPLLHTCFGQVPKKKKKSVLCVLP